MRRFALFAAAVLLATLAAAQAPAPAPAALADPLRGPVPIPQTTRPPLLGNAINDDQRRTRSYDMQPPTIPHRVDGYQVDKNFNKCLDCHARAKSEFSQAVPVSSTHYRDRDDNVLGQVSTRRYFCMQCHVPQDAVKLPVGNGFQDVDTVIRGAAGASAPARR
jgi:nitrate reductase (cytochrome), electron transfer subunit